MSEVVPVEHREVYRPDGYVNFGLLPVMLLLPLFAAVLAGWLMSLCFQLSLIHI